MDASLPAGSSQSSAAAPLSVAQFVKNLMDSGLFSAAEVQSMTADCGPTRITDGRQLAFELIKQQKLTHYQATLLYHGKTRSLVLGRYIILDKLGAGGMGMVFKARHRRMRRLVAVKVLPPDVSKSQAAVQRFRREIQAAAQLDHPNIVHAYDADQAGGVHFLVMEYVDGLDLARLVRSRGPLSVGQAVNCIVQAARGLAAAHAAGIVHRDIKPSNLLIDSKETVKILDLGLARIDTGNVPGENASADEVTKSGSIVGTTDYMAPEQAINSRKADHRADIYSLGCTFYYLLTGQAMYAGETPMEKMLAHREAPIPSLGAAPGQLPQALDAVFKRMVAKKPDERQQSMADVAAEMQDCLSDDGRRVSSLKAIIPTAPPQPQDTSLEETYAEVVANSTATGLASQPSRPPRRFWWGLGGVAVATLALLVWLVIAGSRKPAIPARLPVDSRPAQPVFEALFNGKDLAGWKVFGGTADAWGVADGVLFTTGTARSWLKTEKQYGDFELDLEFRISRGANSGVVLRSLPDNADPMTNGMEVEIVDDSANYPFFTGALCRIANPPKSASRPVGEWNRFHVMALGSKITVELNGTRTVQIDLAAAESPVKNLPGILAPRGHIGLQSSKGRVDFRNLSIRSLAGPTTQTTPG